jgi:hypothetical protein
VREKKATSEPATKKDSVNSIGSKKISMVVVAGVMASIEKLIMPLYSIIE